MICDPDDWTYISYIRSALPLWGNWNPTKIFPETFMGLVGTFAAYCIYPIIGDYVYSISYTFAFVVSLMIAFYLIALAVMLINIFKISISESILVTTVFWTVHFLFFKTKPQYNIFMFTASNLNCFMNYLVPLLLNAVLAFKVIKTDGLDFLKTNNYGKTGIYCLGIYLAIFSNMIVNIVFIAPVTYYFLCEIVTTIKSGIKKTKLEKFSPYIGIYIIEFLCLVFEFNGGRAANLEFDFKVHLQEIFIDLKQIIYTMHFKRMVIMTVIIIIAFVISSKYHREDNDELYSKVKVVVFSLVICIGYTIAIYIRIGQHKILRSENIMVMFIYFAVLFSLCLTYIVKKIKVVKCVMPIALYILLVSVTLGGRHTYKGSISYYSYDVDRCYEINNFVIEQFVNADELGVIEFDLHVPSGLGDYNFSGDRIATTLYKHGIIKRQIRVNLILDNNI